MKKFLLSLGIVLLWSGVINADTFQKVTNPADLAEGDEIIFVHSASSSYYYSTSDITSSTLTSIKVNQSLEDVITIASDDEKTAPGLWSLVSTNTAGQFYLKDSSDFYLRNSSSTNVATHTTKGSAGTNSNFTFAEHEGGVMMLSPVLSGSKPRMLGWNGSDGWKFYAQSNMSGNPPAFVYKKIVDEGPAKTEVSLSWEPSEMNLNLGDAFTAPTLKIEGAENLPAGTITYAAVGLLSVDENGTITLGSGAGTGSVTASIPASNEAYKAAPATFTVTVVDPNKIVDVIEVDNFKQENGAALNGTYNTGTWTSDITGVTYTANAIKSNKNIQINKTGTGVAITKNPNGYIVSRIIVNSASGKSVIVKGSTKAQSSISNYSNSTEIGNAEVGKETTITPNSDYQGLCFTANGGASYISKITIEYRPGAPEKQTVSLSFDKAEYTATVGEAFVAPELKGLPGGLAEYVSYASSEEAVATVANDGTVTIQGAGTTTITANLAETEEYEAGKASYTLTVNKKKPNLSFAEAEETVDLADGDEYTIQTLTCPDGLDITYESDAEAVVLIDGGEAVLMGTGTATITAKSAETLEYEAGEASYKVIVIDSSKTQVTLKWSVDAIEVMEGTEPEIVPTLSVVEPEGLTIDQLGIKYESSEGNVADFIEEGLLIGAPGTAVITAKATGDYEGSASFTVTVTEAPKLGAITVNGQTADENGDFDITVCRGDEITISAVNAVSISYVDTDTDDSKTVEGYKATFSLNKKGVFIYEITVTPYVGEPTSAYLMVTVTNRNPKTDTYEKVTSDEQIVAGAEYVILSVPTNSGTALYGPFAMTTPKSNGKGFDSVVLEAYAQELKPSYEITNTEVAIFTLEAAAGGEWYFKAEGGYLYASGDKLLGYSDENKTAMNIEAGDAETAISFGGYKLLCSPANASTGVPGTITFTNYTSNMKPVILYKRVVNIDSEKLTPVLNDETLTVEKNNEGGFDIKIYHDAEYDDVTIHYLHTKAAQVAGRRAVDHGAFDHGAFAKADSEDGVTHTFSVDGAGKVEYYGYHAGTDTKGIVNSFIINENGTTSIESIMLDGVDPEACYDLQGRRVVRPVRGLFISNGRKVYVR